MAMAKKRMIGTMAVRNADAEVEVAVDDLSPVDVANYLGIREDDGRKHRKDEDDHLLHMICSEPPPLRIDHEKPMSTMPPCPSIFR